MELWWKIDDPRPDLKLSQSDMGPNYSRGSGEI